MNANRLALGIELENLNDGKQGYTDAQYESSARQVLEWWSRFGYLPIVRHSDIDARKTDPKGFGWDAFAYRLLAHRV
jgi:N-acetyl-anhydromuramyl-L-alanine amidase AmpD